MTQMTTATNEIKSDFTNTHEYVTINTDGGNFEILPGITHEEYEKSRKHGIHQHKLYDLQENLKTMPFAELYDLVSHHVQEWNHWVKTSFVSNNDYCGCNVSSDSWPIDIWRSRYDAPIHPAFVFFSVILNLVISDDEYEKTMTLLDSTEKIDFENIWDECLFVHLERSLEPKLHIVKRFIKLGAKPNYKTWSGDNALFGIASIEGRYSSQIEIVPNQDSSDFMEIHKVMTDQEKQECIDIFTYLLEQGWDIETKTSSGHTPFGLACRTNSIFMMECIMKYHPRGKMLLDDYFGHIFLTFCYSPNLDHFKYLIKAGSTFLREHENVRSALLTDFLRYLGTINDSVPSIVSFLIDNGSNIYWRGSNQQSLIDIVLTRRDYLLSMKIEKESVAILNQVVQILKDAGASTTQPQIPAREPNQEM